MAEKVAVVVDYLNQYGGAERVLESLLEIFPSADIFTSIFDPTKFSEESLIRKVRVYSILPDPFKVTSRLTKFLTFLYPFVFRSFNLDAYGLIISSGTIWAKGVRTRPSQKHIYYCHTPARFLYGYASESAKKDVWYLKPALMIVNHFLRIWDFNSAQNPSLIIANGEVVRRRIKKFYRRDSVVIYPPTSFRGVTPKKGINPINTEYFLVVSRLSAYKNIDLAILACKEIKAPLKIVGTGREEGKLRALAGPTVEFLGFVDDERLSELYRSCRAFLCPTIDEDFGITAVEANSFGKVVIAHRSGGVAETQVEGKTALFFREPTVDSLIEALEKFNSTPSSSWDETLIKDNVRRFSRERFLSQFRQIIESNQTADGVL